MDAKEFGLNLKSSPGTMLLTAVIFVALAVLLYWLKSCGKMISNVSLLIYAILGSALYIAIVYSLFTPGVWWYKLILVFFLILLLAFDWMSISKCSTLKDYASRMGINW